MEEDNYSIEDWYEVPPSAIEDPTVAHMMKERVKALDSVRNSNKALREYVMRNYESIAQDMLPALTKAQSKVLNYIINEYCKKGRSPTAVEITQFMKCSSVTSAIYYINALQKKGYIHKSKSKWRSLVPIYNAQRHKISINKPEDEDEN